MANDPFTPDRPYNTTLTDYTGERWHFEYSGRASIRIRPHGAHAGDWANQIDLGWYYGLRPEEVTMEWLDKRAAVWITDRNDDLKSGNL